MTTIYLAFFEVKGLQVSIHINLKWKLATYIQLFHVWLCLTAFLAAKELQDPNHLSPEHCMICTCGHNPLTTKLHHIASHINPHIHDTS